MSASGSRSPLVKRGEIQPVVFWAFLGIGFLLLMTTIYLSWITSEDFKRTYPPVPVGAAVERIIWWNQLVPSLVTLWFAWIWVVKPKLLTGRFSFMGLMVLASASTYWMDPLSNYLNYGVGYNSAFWNRGSWSNFIPGQSYPGMERFPEAPLWMGTVYIWFNVFLPAVFARLWDWIERSFPNFNVLGIVTGIFALGFIADASQEFFYIRWGLYSYMGADQKLSIFGGHFYQFPIFIGVVTSGFLLAYTWIIHFRDSRGYCFAERGVDKLGLSPGAQTFVRFLALVGYMNAALGCIYFIPVQWLYTHGDSFPADTPAYLINDICGDKAGIPCPGRGVPIPRRDGPQKWLIVPNNAK